MRAKVKSQSIRTPAFARLDRSPVRRRRLSVMLVLDFCSRFRAAVELRRRSNLKLAKSHQRQSLLCGRSEPHRTDLNCLERLQLVKGFCDLCLSRSFDLVVSRPFLLVLFPFASVWPCGRHHRCSPRAANYEMGARDSVASHLNHFESRGNLEQFPRVRRH